ncbi:MAG: Crp/Fnr family transcriptional regulator, partial [Roseburia sp.]
MMDINEVVKQIPFWNNLVDEERTHLLSGTVLRTYKKDSYIYGMTDACLGMIYVQRGSIRVYITNEEGREITLFHIGSRECCIMSASCVITGISLDVQLYAEEETEILAIHSGMVQKLMDSNIYVRCFAYELATKRFSDVVWVMQEILFAGFDVRMARFLLSVYEKNGEKKIQMTQEAIAKEVNSAREVVARMLKQFASDELIELNRGAILIKDFEGLK